MFPVDIGSVRPRVGGLYCCPGVEVLPTRPGCTGRLRLRRVFLPGARTRVSRHLESVTAVKLASSADVDSVLLSFDTEALKCLKQSAFKH